MSPSETRLAKRRGGGEALLHHKPRLGHGGHARSLVPRLVRPSGLRPVRGLP